MGKFEGANPTSKETNETHGFRSHGIDLSRYRLKDSLILEIFFYEYPSLCKPNSQNKIF